MHRFSSMRLLLWVFLPGLVVPPTQGFPDPPASPAEEIEPTSDVRSDPDALRLMVRDWGREFPVFDPTPTPVPKVMVDLPPGLFLMGNSGSVRDVRHGEADEFPQHEVTIARSFQLAKNETTNTQCAEILNWAQGEGRLRNSTGEAYAGGEIYLNGSLLLEVDALFSDLSFREGRFTPIVRNSRFTGNDPVKRITWHGAAALCNWLSEQEGLLPAYDLEAWELVAPHGGGYRLPSEAEWEYACRGSAANPDRYSLFSFGDDDGLNLAGCRYSTVLDPYMAWCGNSIPFEEGGWSRPVGERLPNDYGLHDMHGNVWEWCEDWHHPDYETTPTDGSPAAIRSATESLRVMRGGDWYFSPRIARSSARLRETPDYLLSRLGFRLARTP